MKNIEILKAKIKEIEDDKVEKWWLKIIPKTTTIKRSCVLNFLKFLKVKLLIFKDNII